MIPAILRNNVGSVRHYRTLTFGVHVFLTGTKVQKAKKKALKKENKETLRTGGVRKTC